MLDGSRKLKNFLKKVKYLVKNNDNMPVVMPRFSVSLVYIKNIPNGTETALRVLITEANSEEEALGKGLVCFDKEMKNFNLCNKVALQINED